MKEIENKTRRPSGRSRAHFCLSTPNFDAALRDLVNKGVTHANVNGEAGKISIRADGVRQTYFQDPDNYWIEVCEANPDGTVG